MKIFLATARTDDVAWGAAHGMLDGVFTTPAMLSEDADTDARAHLLELCRLVHGPIFAAIYKSRTSEVGNAEICFHKR